MSEYKPDRWVMLKFNVGDETFYKVLAGWGGSYLEGQSWKLNSGVTHVELDGDYYLFSGYSGSVYKCHKDSYGTTSLTASIYSGWKDQLKTDESTIELLPEKTNFMEIEYVRV